MNGAHNPQPDGAGAGDNPQTPVAHQMAAAAQPAPVPVATPPLNQLQPPPAKLVNPSFIHTAVQIHLITLSTDRIKTEIQDHSTQEQKKNGWVKFFGPLIALTLAIFNFKNDNAEWYRVVVVAGEVLLLIFFLLSLRNIWRKGGSLTLEQRIERLKQAPPTTGTP